MPTIPPTAHTSPDFYSTEPGPLPEREEIQSAILRIAQKSGLLAEARLMWELLDSKAVITVPAPHCPTPEAYEAACAALEKHRQRADRAEAELELRCGWVAATNAPTHQRLVDCSRDVWIQIAPGVDHWHMEGVAKEGSRCSGCDRDRSQIEELYGPLRDLAPWTAEQFAELSSGS